MSPIFYHQTLVCVAIWWTFVSSSSRRPLFDVTDGSVVTIPSWIPKQFILFLQQNRPLLFYGETIGIALASCFHESFSIRVLAAFLFTLYHLTESSITNRHGEYPMLYTMWAMCIPDPEYRHACALGIAIKFIFSTGYAKLAAGEFDYQLAYPLWVHPSTMDTYLTSYRFARKPSTRPLYPFINEILSESRMCCAAISCLVLFLECFLVPGMLFVSPENRPLACYLLISMHICIAMVMSIQVGVVFITSLPVYMYGFYCQAEFGTRPWLVAATIGLLPTILNILSQSIGVPENWPFSPAALFMWNGKSAQCLQSLLMTSDTRMVLATKRVASMKDLKGLRVIHYGGLDDGDDHEYMEDDSFDSDDDVPALHDCVLRTIGFTLAQGGEPLIEAVNALQHDPDIMGEATSMLLHRTWAWLTMDRRLVESKTGEDLTHVYLVRVDESMRVTEVLL